MNEKISRLFARKGVNADEIQYMVHREKHTVLYLTDDRELPTILPLKELLAFLPEGAFWNIQKGIAVAARYVLTISDDGVYTMMDGTQFHGRKRNPAEHRRRRRDLELGVATDRHGLPLTFLEKCTVLDNAPIAFCVIELVFAEDGRGIDFIFRYCNKMMEEVEGVTVEEMIDRSFYEVFKNGDRKWIIPYADVALNGVERELRDYSPEIGKNLIIHCFQPHPGYCGCFLIVDNSGGTGA